ncbi:substrate-binding domain-containing protein [Variovorax ginsengisoli]|uniref:LacI family transcriptional regulator n=1 Tax=Variovorax ginsengisoli TaxID=363844 RepID=A0ABT9SEV0_9BURK|nr:substrate-binding domain-containing protein [Variovorax ginsengisoli]MDP9901882.1 LacI family transcriptional regulator [Variovorax ginsengisoli]
MSLKQIAAELNLSLTTVSRALNDYPEVAEGTRRLVQEVARRIGYRANATARRLALGKADAVGMVLPIVPGHLASDVQFLTVAAAMTERLAQEGVDLLLVSSPVDQELRAYERAIATRRVDAFVVPRTQVHDARLKLLAERDVPFVAYGRTEDGHLATHAWLDFDNQSGGRQAGEHLLARGRRRMGYVGAPAVYSFAAQRFAGFVSALEATADATLPHAAVRRDAFDPLAGYQAMQALLTLNAQERPEAVLIDNDLAAQGALQAVKEHGLQLGQDLALVVYGELPAEAAPRGLACMRQASSAETGVELAEMVLALLRDEPIAGLQRLHQPRLQQF